jgi:hypothetical protein
MRDNRKIDGLNLFRPASADINATKEGDSRKKNSNHIRQGERCFWP